MKKTKSLIIELLQSLVIAIVIFLVINFFIGPGQISGQSMYPTYDDNDFILINKVDSKYEKKDIIVFEFNEQGRDFYEQLYTSAGEVVDAQHFEDNNHIKRVVGVGGDNVKIENNILYINDEMVSETDESILLIDQEYKLEEGEYFVQGDNINNSFDSRQHGPVGEDDIMGKAITNK